MVNLLCPAKISLDGTLFSSRKHPQFVISVLDTTALWGCLCRLGNRSKSRFESCDAHARFGSLGMAAVGLVRYQRSVASSQTFPARTDIRQIRSANRSISYFAHDRGQSVLALHWPASLFVN